MLPVRSTSKDVSLRQSPWYVINCEEEEDNNDIVEDCHDDYILSDSSFTNKENEAYRSPSSSDSGAHSHANADGSVVRRKWPKRKRNFIPRVVSKDIRRHYAMMLMNVLNSDCASFQESFFTTYAIPNFQTNFAPIDHSHYSHIPSHLFQKYIQPISDGFGVSGREWFQFHRIFGQILIPDKIHRLNDVRLVTRMRDNRSMIVMSTEVELCHIFDINLVDLMFSQFSFSDESSSEETEVDQNCSVPFSTAHTSLTTPPKLRGKYRLPASLNPDLQLLHSLYNEHSIIDGMTNGYSDWLLTKPRHFLMKTQMVLMVDEHRRIESLTIGHGHLPDDAEAALEAKAAAWRSLSPLSNPA